LTQKQTIKNLIETICISKNLRVTKYSFKYDFKGSWKYLKLLATTGTHSREIQYILESQDLTQKQRDQMNKKLETLKEEEADLKTKIMDLLKEADSLSLESFKSQNIRSVFISFSDIQSVKLFMEGINVLKVFSNLFI